MNTLSIAAALAIVHDQGMHCSTIIQKRTSWGSGFKLGVQLVRWQRHVCKLLGSGLVISFDSENDEFPAKAPILSSGGSRTATTLAILA